MKKPRDPFILALAAVALASLLLLAAFYPRMVNAFKDSGVMELLASHSESSQMRDVAICFIDKDSNWAIFDTSTRKRGSSSLHDSFEALLEGPTEQAINAGYGTAIAKGTQLIGLSVSRETLYASLSKDYLKTEDRASAELQMLKTARQIKTSIEKVIVLVQGTPLGT